MNKTIYINKNLKNNNKKILIKYNKNIHYYLFFYISF